MDNPLAGDLDHILSQTKELWEEVRGKRIFITGGTGFFGCWLLESFCWANRELNLNSKAIVLTRNSAAFLKKAPHLSNDASIELHRGDICSFSFPAEPVSFLIHAFGYPNDSLQRHNGNSNQDVLEKILGGLRHTLNFCIKCGIKKILFVSTGAVYGTPPTEMTHIPEDFSCGQNPADIKNAYHEIRRMAEMVCAIYSDRFSLDIKTARCFAFIGPYIPLQANFAIGNFIGDALHGGPIIIKGDGTAVRSYLYMSDLAVWLWTILLRGNSCSPYNVGSEHRVSIAQVAQMVADCFSPRPGVEIQNRPLQAFAPNKYVPNTSKAREELGLSESVSLTDALKRTIQWHRNNSLRTVN